MIRLFPRASASLLLVAALVACPEGDDDDSAGAAPLAFASGCGDEGELSLEMWRGGSCEELKWQATVRLECERWSMVGLGP